MASRRSKWDDAGVDHADHPHLLPSQPHSSDTLSNRPMHLHGMLHGGASQDHSNTELAELYGLNPSLISTTSVVVSEAAPILREVDINNCKNRYMLTKSQTLHEIADYSGAAIVVRGKYYKQGEQPGLVDEKPLHLHVTAHTKDSFGKALEKIAYYMNMNPKFLIDKVYIDIQDPDLSFNIPAAIIGPKGTYVKYIQNACGGTRAQLKGKGSGYKPQDDAAENDYDPEEPMYLQLTSTSKQNLDKARGLSESLIRKVKQDYEVYLFVLFAFFTIRNIYFVYREKKKQDFQQHQLLLQQHQQNQQILLQQSTGTHAPTNTLYQSTQYNIEYMLRALGLGIEPTPPGDLEWNPILMLPDFSNWYVQYTMNYGVVDGTQQQQVMQQTAPMQDDQADKKRTRDENLNMMDQNKKQKL